MSTFSYADEIFLEKLFIPFVGFFEPETFCNAKNLKLIGL